MAKVIATADGFHNGTRRRVGTIFDMEIPTKDGKPKVPKWVKVVTDVSQAKAEAAKAQKAAQDKQKAGAIAASGGAAAKAKVDAANELAG